MIVREVATLLSSRLFCLAPWPPLGRCLLLAGSLPQLHLRRTHRSLHLHRLLLLMLQLHHHLLPPCLLAMRLLDRHHRLLCSDQMLPALLHRLLLLCLAWLLPVAPHRHLLPAVLLGRLPLPQEVRLHHLRPEVAGQLASLARFKQAKPSRRQRLRTPAVLPSLVVSCRETVWGLCTSFT